MLADLSKINLLSFEEKYGKIKAGKIWKIQKRKGGEIS